MNTPKQQKEGHDLANRRHPHTMSLQSTKADTSDGWAVIMFMSLDNIHEQYPLVHTYVCVNTYERTDGRVPISTCNAVAGACKSIHFTFLALGQNQVLPMLRNHRVGMCTNKPVRCEGHACLSVLVLKPFVYTARPL